MDELSQAEQYLLAQIRRGDGEAWSQLVSRYQGRLCAFARARARSKSDAEDLVQETFLQFLRGVHVFRGEASLETFLFTILRRRLADEARAAGRGLRRNGFASDGPLEGVPAPDPTASAYAANEERAGAELRALAGAMGEVVGRLKREENFRDLRIIEMLLARQMRNKDVAVASGVPEPQIAVIKHRYLKNLQEAVARRMGASAADFGPNGPADSLLTQAWQELRPTCPKRSTIGRYCLGTLDDPWRGYVDFHLQIISCPFCRANLEDVKGEMASEPLVLSHRLFQSTIGFFKPAGQGPAA